MSAENQKPATPTRIMPERTIIGSSGNRMIEFLARPWEGQIRPLAPGERLLGSFIIPPFQRGFVWTEQQQVRLIKSIYMGTYCF